MCNGVKLYRRNIEHRSKLEWMEVLELVITGMLRRIKQALRERYMVREYWRENQGKGVQFERVHEES